MNQGVLYRYSSNTESEEAQLVVSCQELERVLQQYHDSPTAGHCGAEGKYHKIASRYYFPGMRKYISEYVKNCAECIRYKPNNQKPAGLLRTPVYAQRFETLAIDLFGPLTETPTGKKWIFLIEDTSTKWKELFTLEEATAKNCAKILIEEVFLRYANPSEGKNRDLKLKLAILVGDAHDTWEEKLPMNTAICDTTGHTAAYLQFGRELRTTDGVNHDLRALIENDNFVAEITPYLKEFARLTPQIRERVEQKQDKRKEYFDKRRRQTYYQPGDNVWITIHPINPATPDQVLGTYHTNMMRPYKLPPSKDLGPASPIKKRGRPRKIELSNTDSLPGRRQSPRGLSVMNASKQPLIRLQRHLIRRYSKHLRSNYLV
ncbi:protein NYNRIN-like [Stegodyphus dumicola]|uniref:protein NYNRIN-like n=1 Tax=Stegodyphus dumicola TaxID=202533 RepID=UPI0015AF4A9F|nr:protein NYNRIN-like [Stegodyphus dumicola]